VLKPDWTDNNQFSSQGRKALYRLFRKDRLGRQGGGVALYVREELECMELCLGMDGEPTESLRVRIKEKTGRVT